MADDDWRLRGQQDYLLGATLQRKAYRMWSEKWDHDHCEFCWAKFLDPTAKFSDPKAAAWLAHAIEDPEILTCVRDFARRFGWTVQDGPQA